MTERNAVTPVESKPTEFTATFPRSARLLTPGDFTAVFEQRSARRGRFFHLHVGAAKPAVTPDTLAADPPTPPPSRIGIAVPKKLLKTAVHRNLLKRLARELFRQTRCRLDGRDYVLRLAIKLDPKRQPLDRQALARDIRALLAARQLRLPLAGASDPAADATDPRATC